MAEPNTPTVSVWCMRGGKITEVPGCRLGKTMVTLPGGQRWARKGAGTDGYYESEIQAARAFMKELPGLLDIYRTRLSAYESLESDCRRAFEDERRKMHALSAELHGTVIADSIWGSVGDAQAQAVGNGWAPSHAACLWQRARRPEHVRERPARY